MASLTWWARISHTLGNSIRETGQALDRVGCRLQGNYAFKEELCRHRRISPMFGKIPSIGSDVFIAPNAAIIADVNVGVKSSIWYGGVLRGDVSPIEIGSNTCIGDRVVIHGRSSLTSKTGSPLPTTIGNDCYIGNSATIHGCVLNDGCLIDIGALIMDGAVVESSAWVAPGAVVLGGTQVKKGQYWAGNPAKYVRDLTVEEQKEIEERVERAYTFSKIHEEEMMKSLELQDWEKQWDLWTTHKPGTKKPGEEAISYDSTDRNY